MCVLFGLLPCVDTEIPCFMDFETTLDTYTPMTSYDYDTVIHSVPFCISGSSEIEMDLLSCDPTSDVHLFLQIASPLRSYKWSPNVPNKSIYIYTYS